MAENAPVQRLRAIDRGHFRSEECLLGAVSGILLDEHKDLKGRTQGRSSENCRRGSG